jgi:cysteine desulfurase/selenocysteine lyase
LAEVLRTQLAGVSGVTQHDRGATRCGIVSFSVANVPPDNVKSALAKAKVNVELSFIEDTRLDLEERGLDRFVRASVHYYNTEEEIDRLCQLVGALARGHDIA